VFITGLTAEARLLPFRARAGGGTAEGAARMAEAAIREGARALISFGLAGALDPALRPGAILRPAGVLWNETMYPADADLLAALGGSTCGLMLAGEATIAHAVDKQAAHARTGASAVDLESGAVAELAARHGIPFGALRAVCDTATENLPPAALAALDPAGQITLVRVAHSVLRRPAQLPALMALAAHARAARAALAEEIARMSARGALQPWL
jgi:adenosylhomocysteine nucleosidase